MATRFTLAIHDVEEPHPIPGGTAVLSRVVTHLDAETGVTPINATLQRVFSYDPKEPRNRSTPTSYAGASLNMVANSRRFAVYEVTITKDEWADVLDQFAALGIEDWNAWSVATHEEF